MLKTDKLLLVSESSCGLHILGGPDQIVPLLLVSLRADKLTGVLSQALFLCYWSWGGVGAGAGSVFADSAIFTAWLLLRNVL